MKRLLIKEDYAIFKSGFFQPTQALYYANKKRNFLQMIEQQPNWYWLQFVITFRSVVYNRGLVPWKDERRVHCEEAFIAMLDLLSDENPKSRSKKVATLHDDIFAFYEASILRAELGPSASGVFSTDKMVATMDRLYGSAKDYPKKYRKFAVWSVLLSTLIEYHKSWSKSPVMKSKEKLPWSPPAHWREPSKLQRVHLFEEHLMVRWGPQLSDLIDIPTAQIIWWPIIEVMNLKMSSQLLPKVSIVEYDMDSMMLYPWDKPETNKNGLGYPDSVSPEEAAKQEYERMLSMIKDMKVSEN